jgi:Arc/MetJ-type ribon-helix-helix transcriptional regulator
MTVCPACGKVSATCYRCEHCGRDLVDVNDDDDDDDGSSAAPLVADGGPGERKRDRGRGKTMERVTLRIPDDLLVDVEDIAEDYYPTRSEAMREALREFVDEHLSHDPHHRSHLRTDGGPSAARATDRDPRPTPRARIERDEVRRRGGVGDQSPDRVQGCPHVEPGDPLPCFGCLSNGGDGRGE